MAAAPRASTRADRAPGAGPQRTCAWPPWYQPPVRVDDAGQYLAGVATMVDDRLEVRLGGLAQKRGLIPRMPAGDRLLADTAVWLNGEYADIVRSTRTRTLAGGETELAIDLHPATTPVVLTADDAGQVRVSCGHGGRRPGLPPVRRPRAGAARHGGRHRVERRRRRHDVRGSSGRRARLPRLARSAARTRSDGRRAWLAWGAHRHAGRDPGHDRDGRRDRPRAARRGMARVGHRRPAGRPRDHAVVDGRHRRPVPATGARW